MNSLKQKRLSNDTWWIMYAHCNENCSCGQWIPIKSRSFIICQFLNISLNRILLLYCYYIFFYWNLRIWLGFQISADSGWVQHNQSGCIPYTLVRILFKKLERLAFYAVYAYIIINLLWSIWNRLDYVVQVITVQMFVIWIYTRHSVFPMGEVVLVWVLSVCKLRFLFPLCVVSQEYSFAFQPVYSIVSFQLSQSVCLCYTVLLVFFLLFSFEGFFVSFKFCLLLISGIIISCWSRMWLVCVTEQHYVSTFFTRLWRVHKPLLFDTQNPEISGFSTAHAYKYKTKRQAKMKRRHRKMTFVLISHQSTHLSGKQRFPQRP